MGRYAHFSTGFEYKFAFAKQSSSDMGSFGGRGTQVFISQSLSEEIDEDSELDLERKKELQRWIEENEDEDVDIDIVPEEILDFVQNERIESWNKDDLKVIHEELIKINPDQIPKWEEYPLNIEGTDTLWSDLDEKVKDSEEKYRFILGCLIYHQLLYDEELNVSYE